MATSLNLKSILVPSKAVEIEYPGMPNFKLEISFLSRETLLGIRKKSTKSTFKGRQVVEELNEDTFLELYVENSIKGWSGLKLAYLEQLVPVDLSGHKDLEEELEYSKDNALMLMKNSGDFDSFVSNTVSDLGKFTKTK